MRTRTSLLGLALGTSAVPAQMAGTYLLDPSNPAAFGSFTAAVNALFAHGVGGPVEILVSPGSYTESVFVPPIAGTTAANTVTFRPLQGPGTVQLHGGAGDTFAMLGLSFARLRHLVLDGLDFTGAPGHAISGTNYVESIEVRNCTFAAGHQSTALGETRHGVIVCDSDSSDHGWNVHHNHITLSPHTTLTSYGIYVGNGGQWDIHHNTFVLDGGDCGICLVNNNGIEDRIYDNLFTGALNSPSGTAFVAAIRADLANYENRIVHNTFAMTLPGNGACVVTGGVISGGQPVQNHVLGNVFEVTGSGSAIVVEASGGAPQPFAADGNVYHCAGPDVGRIGTALAGVSYATLAAWQLATGRDAASLAVDPQLRNPFGAPPDLRPLPGSPVAGLAVGTPAFVVDDFAGRLRDPEPDAGAYESTSFAPYGAGCRGTGFLVPTIDHSGAVALGSASFRLELSHARPNAPAVLLAGLSRAMSAVGPLPLSLGGTCNLLASPEATTFAVTSATGTAGAPFALPAAPSWSGFDLFFQWAVVDPLSVGSYGIAMSAAGALQL